jgi:hypothetical protein
MLYGLIDTQRLKAGPVSNQLLDAPEAAAVLNDAHEDLIKALARGDSAGVRRAVEKDIFVAGQFLRRQLKTAGRAWLRVPGTPGARLALALMTLASIAKASPATRGRLQSLRSGFVRKPKYSSAPDLRFV